LSKVKRNRRDGVALIASALAHVLVIAILVSQTPPPYELPEPPAPPMDVEIMKVPEIPPPPIVPPKMTPRKIETQAAPPPAPTPPVPEPKPTPAPPAPPKPLPAKPTPPKPTTVVVAPAPPTPPTPQPQPQPPKAAPPKPAAPSPPSPTPAPTRLNIHKPKENAPANVATLPMAPSSAPSSPGAPPGGVQQAPGSRLSGLNPFPLGMFPSGGTGLRGTLVGCANADSVRLSSVERAHCNERFGVEITRAPALDGIAPAKRAAFDKAAAAQDRSLHAGAIDPMGAMEARHGRPTDFGGGVVSGPGSSFIKPGGP
jgi:hypothetical protein